jgi:hypothetical protein
MGNLALTY